MEKDLPAHPCSEIKMKNVYQKFPEFSREKIANSEEPYQVARMRRLVWFLNARICYKLGFAEHHLTIDFPLH